MSAAVGMPRTLSRGSGCGTPAGLFQALVSQQDISSLRIRCLASFHHLKHTPTAVAQGESVSTDQQVQYLS